MVLAYCFRLCIFWHIVLFYCTVIAVVFHYYTVIMHDTGTRSVVKSAAKCQGNAREFLGAGNPVLIFLKT